MSTPTVFIGTPCYSGLLTTSYFQSCAGLMNEAGQRNTKLIFSTLCNESLITRARNTLVQLFMDHPANPTHLLFIDADIGFAPSAVWRLLDYNEEVACSIYPRKGIDWLRIRDRASAQPDIPLQELHAYGLNYNFAVEDPKKVQVDNGFIEVREGGTGFMLIKREAIEKMKQGYPELQFHAGLRLGQAHPAEPETRQDSDNNYAFFDTMIDPDTNAYLSEDYAFCQRWRKIGGTVYADIASTFTHSGTYAFTGNVGAHFQTPGASG